MRPQDHNFLSSYPCIALPVTCSSSICHLSLTYSMGACLLGSLLVLDRLCGVFSCSLLDPVPRGTGPHLVPQYKDHYYILLLFPHGRWAPTCLVPYSERAPQILHKPRGAAKTPRAFIKNDHMGLEFLFPELISSVRVSNFPQANHYGKEQG